MTASRITTVCLAYSLFLLSLMSSGCGPGICEVRGKVFCDGKPLASGTIQFLGVDGVPHAAVIEPDGSFRVQMQHGEARVIVSCMNEVRLQQINSTLAAAARGQVVMPETPPQENLSLIPQRYADWQLSGLSLRVAGRTMYQDFYLTTP
ncbi:MAG TPA: hypothetical protein VFE62_17210 [Gemmataceae bacterium]|nr:hypothetical protein [Gemmataceae bacterium]